MIPLQLCFSATYGEARERFLSAAAARDVPVRSYVHPDRRGAEGECLAMDVAWLGAPNATRVVMVSSGVHGAEGFCGSGCQLGLLKDEDLNRRLHHSDLALMLVHAVNPYGFSHLRRVNEDNIDVNRNFLDFDTALIDSSAYDEVHQLLLPEQWPPDTRNAAATAHYIETRGPRHFQRALSGGQDSHADGMFYAGHAPCWSNYTLRALLREHLSRCKALNWIDIHTGLGPTGHGEKIHAYTQDQPELARALACWGADVFSPENGDSCSEPIVGHGIGIAAAELPQACTLAIALEFGTLDQTTVLQALRADHWLQRHPEAGAAQHLAIKKALRDAFYIDTPAWQAMVYGQARVAVLQALTALTSVHGA